MESYFCPFCGQQLSVVSVESEYGSDMEEAVCSCNNCGIDFVLTVIPKKEGKK